MVGATFDGMQTLIAVLAGGTAAYVGFRIPQDRLSKRVTAIESRQIRSDKRSLIMLQLVADIAGKLDVDKRVTDQVIKFMAEEETAKL